MTDELFAGIELGGTKAMALLARGTQIVDRLRLPTDAPEPTLAAVADWLEGAAARHGAFAALGIASFGPLGLDPGQPGHGGITNTPKPGWAGVELQQRFAARFGVPVGLDTDVNGAALAEGRWGAARDARVHVYLTIGTGVGGGVVVDGRAVHGLLHPEIGHVRVRRVTGDRFPGICPFHGDCVEGLVSGPAIAARAGMPAQDVPPDHPVWADCIADLAELLAMLMLTVSPERILIGGGVGMGQPWLFPALRTAVIERLGGYVPDALPALRGDLIAPPGLGADAGPLGAIALAMDALVSAP